MTIYIGNRDSSASRRGATPLALGPADSVNSFLSCSGLGKQFNVLLRTLDKGLQNIIIKKDMVEKSPFG